MFRCQSCGKAVPPNIKSTEVVIKSRNKQYSIRPEANRMAKWKDERQDRIESTKDNGGDGWEIAKTQRVCPACAKSYATANESEASFHN